MRRPLIEADRTRPARIDDDRPPIITNDRVFRYPQLLPAARSVATALQARRAAFQRRRLRCDHHLGPLAGASAAGVEAYLYQPADDPAAAVELAERFDHDTLVSLHPSRSADQADGAARRTSVPHHRRHRTTRTPAVGRCSSSPPARPARQGRAARLDPAPAGRSANVEPAPAAALAARLRAAPVRRPAARPADARGRRHAGRPRSAPAEERARRAARARRHARQRDPDLLAVPAGRARRGQRAGAGARAGHPRRRGGAGQPARRAAPRLPGRAHLADLRGERVGQRPLGARRAQRPAAVGVRRQPGRRRRAQDRRRRAVGPLADRHARLLRRRPGRTRSGGAQRPDRARLARHHPDLAVHGHHLPRPSLPGPAPPRGDGASPSWPASSSAADSLLLRDPGRDHADPGLRGQHRVRRLPPARLLPRPRRLHPPAVRHPRRPPRLLQRHPDPGRRWPRC